MSERVDWAAVDAHVDAYMGYPDIQASIRRSGDTGGVATMVVACTVEVPAA